MKNIIDYDRMKPHLRITSARECGRLMFLQLTILTSKDTGHSEQIAGSVA
jgi:hypothetical protein